MSSLNDVAKEFYEGSINHKLGLVDSFDISRGLVPGISELSKFGRNSEIDTATDPEDIWNGGGLYTGFPDGAAETIDVFSSSILDDDGNTGYYK